MAVVAAVAREHFGRETLDGAVLAAEVQRLSALYNAGRAPESGDARALCARLRFFMPRDLPKLDGPLAELAQVDAFPERDSLRVLDLGAGVGTSTLALARFAARTGIAARLEVDAVDHDTGALALARRVWARAGDWGGVPITARPIAMDLARPVRARLNRAYDVVLLGLVWNELARDEPEEPEERAAERHLAWLAEITPLVADDGVLVIVEPALRQQTRILHRVRDALARRPGPPHVFAPCVRRGDCPMLARERDWCHELVPSALPATLAALARMAGLREHDLTYSYLTLHMQARSLREVAPVPLLRVVGGPLRTKGKRELFVCGDVDATRVRLLDRDATMANAVFDVLGRGDVVTIAGDVPTSDAWRVRDETRVVRFP